MGGGGVVAVWASRLSEISLPNDSIPWDVLVDHLSLELRAFLDAPMIFIGAWAAIAVATWASMRWAYGERLASKDERITAHAREDKAAQS
jgi:hypothetical protein